MPTPSRKTLAKLTKPIQRLAYTPLEFCAAVGISPSTYQRMKREGGGPREARVWDGSEMTIITSAAADEWIAERDRLAQEDEQAQESEQADK
ncbi:hypothetical protein Q2941_17395 [Bradyrhizobium sp. UFLA05-153]